jgi:hypothetical protein
MRLIQSVMGYCTIICWFEKFLDRNFKKISHFLALLALRLLLPISTSYNVPIGILAPLETSLILKPLDSLYSRTMVLFSDASIFSPSLPLITLYSALSRKSTLKVHIFITLSDNYFLVLLNV